MIFYYFPLNHSNFYYIWVLVNSVYRKNLECKTNLHLSKIELTKNSTRIPFLFTKIEQRK